MRRIFFTLVFCLGLVSYSQGEEFFKVKEYAATPSGVFYFQDLVYKNNKLDSLWLKLKDKIIFKVKDNRVYYLNKEEVNKAFAFHIGSLASKLIYPSRLVLKKADKVLSPQDIFHLVQKELLPIFVAKGEKVNFRDFMFSSAIFLNKKEHLKIKIVGRPKVGRNGVVAEVRDAFNQKRGSYSGSVFVDVWKSVPVLGAPLNRGEPLNPAVITYKLKNLAYISKDIWNGKNFNYRLRVSLGVGEVLTLDKLEPIPVVSKGDKVTIVYQGNSVLLKGIGIALEDGFLGEKIVVKNMDSQRKIIGKVINSGEIRVF
ncbi:MAG: flagellar basal body P-ring formation protein FlgA [Desulfonauticus sp.]|jgi:flagella basal body P-ring formation protein FlgA|nr:flagellar basal body P-ring formation protein FlgA [Desulfonauticus sp.]